MESKWVGLALALISSLLIGSSFVVTKMGLMRSRNSGTAEGYDHLTNSLWWAGMIIMVLGELVNFAAYSFAPAVLVTPLGALSVLISAILASLFLGEKLGRDGIIGCTLAILGSIMIILHAPEERKIDNIDEMLASAVKPGFLTYCVLVIVITLVLIFHYAKTLGKKNPLIFISICSLVGSITVIACKALGTAVRLTIEGANQFTYFSTYFFLALVGLCIAVQMNYFNKALDIFSTNVVTPIYYVFFTTATIAASAILFNGVGDSNGRDMVSVFCGFVAIFIGVFLLNTPKSDLLPRSNSKTVGSVFDATLLHNFDETNLGFTGLREEEDP